MKNNFETLPSRIRELIKAHDDAVTTHKAVEGQRRAHLSGHSEADSGHSERLHSFNHAQAIHKRTQDESGRQLAAILPQVRAAVAEIAGSKPSESARELVALLDSGEESALVKCEAAAEFIESQSATAAA